MAFLCMSLSFLGSEETIYVDESDPPFSYNLNGESVGAYVSVVREAFRRMGEPVTVIAVPWKRAMAGIDSGRAGVAGIYSNLQRLKIYDFSLPYHVQNISVYVLSGNPLGIRTIEDLAGKRVINRFGWSYGDVFDRMVREKRLEAVDVQSDEQALRMLASGRGDVALLNSDKIQGRLLDLGLTGKVKALPFCLPIGEVFLAYAKVADKKELLRRFDAALASMEAEGTLARLLKAGVEEWEALGSPD